MNILFQCPQCGKALRVPGEAVGTNIQCTGCGNAIEVEKPAAEFSCVKCSTELGAFGRIMGKLARCPTCGEKVAIPRSRASRRTEVQQAVDPPRLRVTKPAPDRNSETIRPAATNANGAPGRQQQWDVVEKAQNSVIDGKTLRIAGCVIAATVVTLIGWSLFSGSVPARRKSEEPPPLVQEPPAESQEEKLLRQLLYPDDYKIAIDKVYEDTQAMTDLIARACRGDAAAEYELGARFEADAAVHKDHQEAVKWLTRSAASSNTEALCTLGIFSDLDQRGSGTPFFEKAARLGHSTGQYLMGLACLNGSGVQSNSKEAVRWLTESAGQGDSDAMKCLGDCYARGIGVQEDKKEAYGWLVKSARQGNPDALALLIMWHLDGKNGPPDALKAITWVDRAPALGIEEPYLSILAGMRMRILERHARSVFGRNNDPQFKGDGDLVKVANAVACFYVRYPDVPACKELIWLCDRLEQKTQSEPVRLALEGSRWIFQSEIKMTEAGYHRWGRAWVNDEQLAQLRQLVAERNRRADEMERELAEKRARAEMADMEREAESKHPRDRRGELLDQIWRGVVRSHKGEWKDGEFCDTMYRTARDAGLTAQEPMTH